MKVDITRVAVEERYPGAVRLFADILAESTSRERGRPDTDMTFRLEWYESVSHDNIGMGIEGLTRMLRTPPRREEFALDERAVAEKFGPRVGWCLIAKIGRWSRALRPDAPLPPEIVQVYLRSERQRAAERGRVEGLTPEQRRAEADDALRKLAGSPGFAAFGFTIDPKLLDEAAEGADDEPPPPGPRF